jgi:flavin-dependent dehydrogenase
MGFDVLIVGAGPAGSFAAELLANGGARVALFDGRPEGEPKACGGGVTAKALKAWPHLLNAVGRTISELDLYSPTSKRLHLALDEPFAIYSRIAFDCYLRERARDAGAQVIAQKISARKTNRAGGGWRVVGDTGAEWTSGFLIGADGANSGIAKMLAGPLPHQTWKSHLVIARRCPRITRRRQSWPSCPVGLDTRGRFRVRITSRSASRQLRTPST